MLGTILAFAFALITAVFVWMNKDIPDATLRVCLRDAIYEAHVAPWLIILTSLFAGAVLTFLIGHGREMGLLHRLKEREAELGDMRGQLRKVEDALLELVPKPEGGTVGAYEEEVPPERTG